MLMLSDKIKPLRCIGNLTGMLFYKVSSNHPGVGMERRRESKNIKVLVVCRTVRDSCKGLAERGCCSKKQDQTTVKGRGAKRS